MRMQRICVSDLFSMNKHGLPRLCWRPACSALQGVACLLLLGWLLNSPSDEGRWVVPEAYTPLNLVAAGGPPLQLRWEPQEDCQTNCTCHVVWLDGMSRRTLCPKPAGGASGSVGQVWQRYQVKRWVQVRRCCAAGVVLVQSDAGIWTVIPGMHGMSSPPSSELLLAAPGAVTIWILAGNRWMATPYNIIQVLDSAARRQVSGLVQDTELLVHGISVKAQVPVGMSVSVLAYLHLFWCHQPVPLWLRVLVHWEHRHQEMVVVLDEVHWSRGAMLWPLGVILRMRLRERIDELHLDAIMADALAAQLQELPSLPHPDVAIPFLLPGGQLALLSGAGSGATADP